MIVSLSVPVLLTVSTRFPVVLTRWLPNATGDGVTAITGSMPLPVSVYDAGGFFQKNARNAYTVNDVTAKRNADGTVTIHFGGDEGASNSIPIMPGWNYVVRMYRPRKEILDGSWKFPDAQPVN